MRRVCLIILMVLLLATGAWGASSQIETRSTSLPGDVDTWTIAWQSHTDGTYTNYNTVWSVNGYVFTIVTDPGAAASCTAAGAPWACCTGSGAGATCTAPGDDYDITLLDADGVDVLGGEGADRDTANTEQIVPKIGNTYGTRYVNGPLTLTISGLDSAVDVGEVIIYIWGGK